MFGFQDEFEGNIDQESKKGNFFIIDLVANNPMRPTALNAMLIVSNATKEDMEKIKTGTVRIPPPMPGTKQRLTLKVDSVNDIGTKEIPNG